MFYVASPLLKALQLSFSSSEYYATWVKKAKLSQLLQMPDKSKLFLHLAAFIQHQFYSRQDAFIDIFLHSVQGALNKAKNKRLTHEQLQRTERTKLIQKLVDEKEQLESLILEIANVIHVETLSDSKKVSEVKLLIQQHQDLQKTLTQQENYASQKKKIKQLLTDDDYYDILEEVSISLQRYVNTIVKTVEFNQESSDQNIIMAIQYFKNKEGNIDQEAPTSFLETKQLAIIYDANQKLRVSLYKILLFSHMANCIKSGSLTLSYSYRYKAIQDYLISPERWQSQKQQLIKSAGLTKFTNANQVLVELKTVLNKSYHQVNQEIMQNNNPHIRFESDGKFILATPRVEKKNTETISDLLSDTGFVPIIQILGDINRVSQFANSFKHYSIKNQKLKPTAELIIAGLMAKGHNIGINKIGHISVGINSNTLRQTVNWFFTLPNIQAANHRIIALINKLALSSVFRYKPEITHTSSDGQKYYVAVDSLLANYSFKYFGKDKGVSVYTFVDDKQSLFYSTVISASEREAAYVVDGLLHNTVVKSDIHSTDMHGYTESMFAATHFIGTSFAPRFKQLNRQQIYNFSARQTYVNKGYKILPSRIINSNLIREYWDDILRFMVTIKLKETPASILFKRLSSYAKDHPLYQAIKEFGRIIKSQYILTYIEDLKLRQEIEKQLNRVELSNKFSKAVFFDKDHEFTVASREEQEIITACKSLIQNAIVLWNYMYLTLCLLNTKADAEKQNLLAAVKNGSVMTWQHVNMRGEYDFTKIDNKSRFDLEKLLSLKINSYIAQT